MITALSYPKQPMLAIKIYNFLRMEMHKAMRYIGGMSPSPHYMDKQYLRIEMKEQLNMDFNKYSFIVPKLEEVIFKEFENQKK